MFQIASGNRFPLGMRGQPALAVLEEFFEFVLTHPVVLKIVEDGDQHVQVREQFAHGRPFRELHRVVRAFSPPGKPFIQRIPDGLDTIAQGLEDLM